MAAIAQRPIDDQAVDRGDVVRLEAQAAIVELLDLDVFHRDGTELVQGSARRLHARRNVLEPGLVGGDLDRLPGLLELRVLQDALPTLPREFVVVPDAHKRPASARVLQVGVGEIALPDRAVSLDRRRDVENSGLQRVRNPRNLVEFPAEAGLPVFWILHDLVDEIAKVQDEIELVLGPRPLILEDHAAVAVELAFVDVLAADEGEFHRPRIVGQRRGDRVRPIAAAVPVGVGEAVPIDVRGLEPADQHPAGPVGRRRNRRRRMRDDPAKTLVLSDFDGQHLTRCVGKRPPRPQDHAARVGIARGDALGIEIAALRPFGARSAGRPGPRQRRAHRRRKLDEFAAVGLHVLIPCSVSPHARPDGRP